MYSTFLLYNFVYRINIIISTIAQEIMQEVVIKTAAQLRESCLPTKVIERCDEQKDYYSFLVGKGLIVNPKVTLSYFHLKNGLPYVGMAANELISEGEVLIRVPEELIISSAKVLEETQLSLAFQHAFFINEFATWQDRVLIVYCMYLLQQKDENNPWFQMIKSFPKECDIACFWPEEELNTFKDLTVISAAGLDLKSFNQQWRDFQECQKLFPILQGEEFNRDNYKNIFINLTNRSFGKNLSFISMVPFAEFFNHHCSKVYYMTEKQKKSELKDENVSDDQSSIGSYDSNDYLQQGQFAYDTIQVTPFNWQVEESYELEKKESVWVKEQVQRVMLLLENELYWQDFTVLFVGHLMLKLKIIEKQYLVGRKPFPRTEFQLKIVESTYNRYKNMIADYYRQAKKKEYCFKEKQVKGVNKQHFVYPSYKKEYESVVLKTAKFDRFEANNQIYFKYGRNSNRSLLLRYGFAIQDNKYQHVWVSFSIAQCLQDFPDVLQKVMQKKLSLLRKFKIHHHILNIDIIIFFRLNSWMFYHEQAVNEIFQVVNIPKEISILQQIISILEPNLQNYDGQYNLTDAKLNYHQYFIAVYHKEKYIILQKQLAMLRKLITILTSIEQGQSKEEAASILSRSERKVMKFYIESIQC